MAYFGNSDFTGLVADDFNHKKKDKSSSSTDVSGNKRKGTAVERARVRLQESGDKTTKLFHTMGDMVSSDIRFAGFKRGKTYDDVKIHCERTNGSDDVKVHFGEPVDAVTVRDEQQEGCPPTPDGRRREDVPTVLNYSRGSTADLDEVRGQQSSQGSASGKVRKVCTLQLQGSPEMVGRSLQDQRMEPEGGDSLENRGGGSSPEEGKIQISEFVPVLDQETIRRSRGRVDRPTPTSHRRWLKGRSAGSRACETSRPVAAGGYRSKRPTTFYQRVLARSRRRPPHSFMRVVAEGD